MGITDDLAEALRPSNEVLRQALARAESEGRGRGCVDAGGLRVAWRVRNGKEECLIESYILLECSPCELLSTDS